MSDATQLLPCPFCDSINIKEGHIRDGRHIACQNCGASVSAYHPTASADARAKWNRRAGKAAWVPDKPTPPWSLEERLSRLEAVVEILKPAAEPQPAPPALTPEQTLYRIADIVRCARLYRPGTSDPAYLSERFGAAIKEIDKLTRSIEL